MSKLSDYNHNLIYVDFYIKNKKFNNKTLKIKLNYIDVKKKKKIYKIMIILRQKQLIYLHLYKFFY